MLLELLPSFFAAAISNYIILSVDFVFSGYLMLHTYAIVNFETEVNIFFSP